MSADHLHPEVRPLLEENERERIKAIAHPRWIGYTRAREVLARLEDLLTHPKTHRMPNLLLVGETNNGKTQIVNRFQQLHPAYDHPTSDGIILPVLIVRAPPVPDEHRLYNRILETLGAPYKHKENIDKKQFQVFRVLRQLRLKMLVIDEIHDIIAGPLTRQRQFLNVVKDLGNELQIPIVGVGTHDAFAALQTDPQLSNRFEPMLLPRWSPGTESRRLLASFEQVLPLRQPSNLSDPALATRLLAMAEGTIGELSSLLSKAAVQAIRMGSERIEIGMLESIDWIPPSERRRSQVGA